MKLDSKLLETLTSHATLSGTPIIFPKPPEDEEVRRQEFRNEIGEGEGRKKKRLDVPVCGDETCESLFKTLIEAKEVFFKLRFTNDEILENLPLCFEGPMRDLVKCLIAERDPKSKNLAGEEDGGVYEVFQAIKRSVANEDDFESTIQYYRELTSFPDCFSISSWKSRLKTINLLLSEAIGSKGKKPFTDNELKLIFFKTMNVRATVAFKDSGKKFKDETLDTICRYMLQQKLNALVRKQMVKKAGEKSVYNHPLFNPSEKKKNKKRKRTDEESDEVNDCRYHHGHHPWRLCYFNRNGPNYMVETFDRF